MYNNGNTSKNVTMVAKDYWTNEDMTPLNAAIAA